MFTENQVRQFYVIPTGSADTTNVKEPTKIVTGTSGTYPADLSALAAGACQFVINPSGDEAYMLYKGPSSDGLQRSDLLKKCNITDVRFTDAGDLKHKMKKVEIALDSNVSATPIVGQDYILNVEIKNYIAIGNDSTKVKFGAAHAFNTTASDLYKALAINLAKNLARESVALLNVSLKTTSDPVPVTASSTTTSLAAVTATGIILEEVEQPWRRGVAQQEFVNFEAMPSTIYSGGADVVWGTVTDVTANNTNYLPNSKKVADMEWFFHKERGDVYGEVGYPNNIDTVYQVDPSNSTGYSFIDIHYFAEGNSHNVGKSEKTLTIVGSTANLKRFIGSAAVTGGSPSPATGLYLFLEGTGVNIKTSTSWT